MRSTLDYSQQVLGDDLLNTDEKRCIQEDVDRLKSSKDELKRDVAEMHERFVNLLQVTADQSLLSVRLTVTRVLPRVETVADNNNMFVRSHPRFFLL